eukprot:CCRYP_019378-RA/>CCRYP_019378-RA protein AED:0.20 eAED:0.21 QI:0/0.5/0.33/1/0.5/0.33/3/1472/91
MAGLMRHSHECASKKRLKRGSSLQRKMSTFINLMLRDPTSDPLSRHLDRLLTALLLTLIVVGAQILILLWNDGEAREAREVNKNMMLHELL